MPPLAPPKGEISNQKLLFCNYRLACKNFTAINYPEKIQPARQVAPAENNFLSR